MNNRIKKTTILSARVTPAEAELWVTVYPEQVTSTTLVQGKLIGPRCRYASTVEVAYPLREHHRQYEKEGTPCITLRAVIPEPSLWDPQSPLFYDCRLELWQSREHAGQQRMTYGLHTISLLPQGLRWNGKPLVLAGVTRKPCSEEESARLRARGCNALLVPAEEVRSCSGYADQIGVFVLGHIVERKALTETLKESTQVSALGWVLAPELLDDPLVMTVLESPSSSEQIAGVELRAPRALPGGIRFICCEEDDLGLFEGVALPKLVKTKRALSEIASAQILHQTGLLGYLHSS